MTTLRNFGIIIIWCIFACGCSFSKPRQINFENYNPPYLALHTEAQINKINQEQKGEWREAKQSNINANKYWKAYLNARLGDQHDDSLRNTYARQK